MALAPWAAPRRWSLEIVVVEDFAQIFFEFSVGEHFLEPAPGGLAAFALRSYPLIHPG